MSEKPPDEDLADLYDNAPCGYLSLSPDGKIVKVNRTLLAWLERDERELLGQPVHAIFSFGGKIAFETHLAPLLRLQGVVHEIALDVVRADGARIPVVANAAERRGPGGQHLFTRLTLLKAVDRRTFERGLIEARVEAEKAAQAERDTIALREQLMAVLGHDLRNPLAAVAAGLAVLRRGADFDEHGKAVAGEMERSLDRANGLIDDVLDFARGRLGGGIKVERCTDRPLEPVLEQVVEEMRAISPLVTIEMNFDLRDRVACDPDRIGQLASNLLANAVTHGTGDRPIRLAARTEGEVFELSVCNSGDAIPAAVRAQLFQPFVRGEIRPSKQGLGLGLFIVNEIATAHGGAMDVESSDTETRFIFRMPRNVPDVDRTPPSTNC